MKKPQKSGFGIVGIIIIIAAVAVLGGGYFGVKKYLPGLILGCPDVLIVCADSSIAEPRYFIDNWTCTDRCSDGKEAVHPGELLQNKGVDTSTWKTYRNEKYGFEVKYQINKDYSGNYGEGYFSLDAVKLSI